MELKENLYDVSNNSYTFVDSTQQHEFIVPLTGYYKVEIYNANGKYVSGNIYLIKNEKLYFDISNNSNNATSNIENITNTAIEFNAFGNAIKKASGVYKEVDNLFYNKMKRMMK